MQIAMDSSESSSEDECNIYVNAASKLNALNYQAKPKYNDECDDMIIDDSQNARIVKQCTKNIICTDKWPNDNCYIVEDSNQTQFKNKNLSKSSVICIDDDISCSDYGISTRTISRRSKKQKNTIPTKEESTVILNDSIEEELDKTFNLQEENDSYIVIGSPASTTNYDSDNYEVSVKVLWRSNKLNRFEIQRYETFQKIFQHFAKIEGVPENQILIMKNDKKITPFDSPVSIDWSVIDILDGGIVSAEVAKKNYENSIKNNTHENTCKIKVQISDKKSLLITLKTDQSFTALINNCSEQLSIPESKLKLYFDGELINIFETPMSLDLDEEACMDLKISE
ncbi:PREDICTED: uncharacterized protein CG4449 [Ceratosolen solmsi marchali]|uniref:Uncharacterized protein CG4449 n=1 Tax=Ceratosolen solmsi marchali TaxID=326594 RepID=A0AAJ7DU48_9HYME|nr:PREDICTED: uncharacterized protein CG4449 [Ceratosolen solmsi marchali]